MRTCAVCRQVRPKRSMTRLVRTVDGSIVQDPTGKATGRGTYVCEEPACQEPQRLAQAVGRALGAAMKPGSLTI
ncbi:MAG TPA: YlxR family protein [Candidatus Limnocylindria bacterium]|nr:YlxR family protein [Candidatus Limnocylindria bacterium]